MFVGKERVMVMIVCDFGYVGVILRILWRSLGVGMGVGMVVLGWVCVGGMIGCW